MEADEQQQQHQREDEDHRSNCSRDGSSGEDGGLCIDEPEIDVTNVSNSNCDVIRFNGGNGSSSGNEAEAADLSRKYE